MNNYVHYLKRLKDKYRLPREYIDNLTIPKHASSHDIFYWHSRYTTAFFQFFADGASLIISLFLMILIITDYKILFMYFLPLFIIFAIFRYIKKEYFISQIAISQYIALYFMDYLNTRFFNSEKIFDYVQNVPLFVGVFFMIGSILPLGILFGGIALAYLPNKHKNWGYNFLYLMPTLIIMSSLFMYSQVNPDIPKGDLNQLMRMILFICSLIGSIINKGFLWQIYQKVNLLLN